MRVSAIRHLAITDDRAIVAAALFEKTVQIWSWETAQQIGEINTILSFGGKRLLLTPDGNVCIAGSWTRGIAAYSIPDGRVIWHRKDIRQVQQISLSSSARQIYCGVEANLVHVLDTENGKSIGKLTGARSVVASPFEGRELIEKRDSYLVRGEGDLQIYASSVLHTAAFSPERVCLSELNKGSRCIDLTTGKLVWHRETFQFLHAVFNAKDGRFYLVTTVYADPGERALVRLAADFGEPTVVVGLDGSWEEAFTPSGEFLASATGDVFETASGALRTHLDFPTKEKLDSNQA